MPRRSARTRDRFEIYVACKRHDGVGVAVWELYSPELAAIAHRDSESQMETNSTTLLTLEGLIAGLSATSEGSPVTCIADHSKVVEMAQRIAEYRDNGFRSSGKPIANQEQWLLLADLVSRRSVDFRRFRGVGEDRKVRESLLMRADSALAHSRS